MVGEGSGVEGNPIKDNSLNGSQALGTLLCKGSFCQLLQINLLSLLQPLLEFCLYFYTEKWDCGSGDETPHTQDITYWWQNQEVISSFIATVSMLPLEQTPWWDGVITNHLSSSIDQRSGESLTTRVSMAELQWKKKTSFSFSPRKTGTNPGSPT